MFARRVVLESLLIVLLVKLCSSYDCQYPGGVTKPSNCCHENKSILKQDVLQTCLSKQPEGTRLSETLICYFQSTGALKSISDGLNITLAENHLTENYPALTRPVFKKCAQQLIDDEGIPTKSRISFNLTHWLLCIERQLVRKCPKDNQIHSELCTSTRKFLDICVLQNASKMDYFTLVMTDLLIYFDSK